MSREQAEHLLTGYIKARYLVGEYGLDEELEQTFRDVILDAMTARAERTCKVIEMLEHVTMDEPDIAELSCGHDIMVFDMEPPHYCPHCGRKVIA